MRIAYTTYRRHEVDALDGIAAGRAPYAVTLPTLAPDDAPRSAGPIPWSPGSSGALPSSCVRTQIVFTVRP